jgi:hypothetical protein
MTLSIIDLNFTLQDLIGATLAFCLFPLVIIFPGYVVGWIWDLFDFRGRQSVVKLGIGLILSFAISPIILDLTSSLVSLNFSLILLGGFAIAFLIIVIKEKAVSAPESKRHAKMLFWVSVVWVAFAILSLIDIQWKDQLYYSVISFDQTSRVSVTDAMTRTGVPPINPGYYPGRPTQLTFLYYFWYILASQIDLIGGRIIDARAALNASTAWAGIGLMAIIAFYLRQRNVHRSETAWRFAWIGIALLTVSGLDVLFFILTPKTGNIGHWNNLQFGLLIWNNILFKIFTMVGTWIGSILWVPHHIASLIAGFTAILLAHTARRKILSKQIPIFAISGLGFASSLGLSVWITIIFVVFWIIWIIVVFIQKAERALILPMILTGVVALFLASPFLLSMFQGGGGGTGQSPIIFEIRTFPIFEPFVKGWSQFARSLVLLAILPVDLFIELGFFLMAGIYWIKIKDKGTIHSNPFYLTETILLIVVLFCTTCLRSTLTNNDLGLRTWLVGQFILLIWGVDVVEAVILNKNGKALVSFGLRKTVIARNLLQVLIVIGILTSAMDALYLRFFWVGWSGQEIGQEIYSSRLAYDYLRDHFSPKVIIQNNPLISLDRPGGLYGTHQMVIADRTGYGVPQDDLKKFVDEIGLIFTAKDMTTWETADRICQKYSIDILVVNDMDPIWNNLIEQKTQRPPLYKNPHYALFACGNYAQNK